MVGVVFKSNSWKMKSLDTGSYLVRNRITLAIGSKGTMDKAMKINISKGIGKSLNLIRIMTILNQRIWNYFLIKLNSKFGNIGLKNTFGPKQ